MKDVFGQELAVGDDVAIRIRTDLYRGHIVRFTAKQATVLYWWASRKVDPIERSVGRNDIIKMVEGDHKPEVLPTSLPASIMPTFVFDPNAGGTD
jgi:hypothetical protein